MSSASATEVATFGLNVTFVAATIQELDPSTSSIPTDTSYLGVIHVMILLYLIPLF